MMSALSFSSAFAFFLFGLVVFFFFFGLVALKLHSNTKPAFHKPKKLSGVGMEFGDLDSENSGVQGPSNLETRPNASDCGCLTPCPPVPIDFSSRVFFDKDRLARLPKVVDAATLLQDRSEVDG